VSVADIASRIRAAPLILRNRGAGPFGLLNLVDERCGDTFDHIDVIPPEERAAFMAGYKAAAGFAIETLHAAAPTIAEGAMVKEVVGCRRQLICVPRVLAKRG